MEYLEDDKLSDIHFVGKIKSGIIRLNSFSPVCMTYSYEDSNEYTLTGDTWWYLIPNGILKYEHLKGLLKQHNLYKPHFN